jgi:hypothetical protein
MGVYTWVSKYCCDEELDFQSKSHPTQDWGAVDIDSVPVEMARDIENDVKECPHCGRRYRIQVRPRNYETVPMEIVCENEDEIVEPDEIEEMEESNEAQDDLGRRITKLYRNIGVKR